MHVISGILKGRRIVRPEGSRPTGGKVKEALFNILSNRIDQALFLDLYAGSGGVGLEALSRGARHVVFVDSEPRTCRSLKQALSRFWPDGKSHAVICQSVSRFLKTHRAGPFDLVYVDPPYQSDEVEVILPLLATDDMIAMDGRVIIEHFHKKPLPDAVGCIRMARRYRYGGTMLSFYERGIDLSRDI